jgi:hypothetical protein
MKHVLTTVATPRSAGQVERINGVILERLTTLVTNERHWDRFLEKVRWSLNNTRNETTRKTPNELLMGYRPRNREEAFLIHDLEIPTASENLAGLRQAVDKQIQINQSKMKKRDEKQRKKQPRIYVEGDFVLAPNIVPADGKSRKLKPIFKGPYKILKVLGNDRYLVQGQKRSIPTVYATEQLRPYLLRIDTDTEEDKSNT